MLAEKEMLEGLKSKDPVAFNYLYDKYSSSLYGMILKLTSNTSVATAILERSFMICWNNSDKYDPLNGRLFTFLMNIAIQECANEFDQPKQVLLKRILPSAKRLNKEPVVASVFAVAY